MKIRDKSPPTHSPSRRLWPAGFVHGRLWTFKTRRFLCATAIARHVQMEKHEKFARNARTKTPPARENMFETVILPTYLRVRNREPFTQYARGIGTLRFSDAKNLGKCRQSMWNENGRNRNKYIRILFIEIPRFPTLPLRLPETSKTSAFPYTPFAAPPPVQKNKPQTTFHAVRANPRRGPKPFP